MLLLKEFPHFSGTFSRDSVLGPKLGNHVHVSDRLLHSFIHVHVCIAET